jgi:hypothetical protein
MSTQHRIRLRQPWECHREAVRIVWRRRFGRPTNLGPNEQVWLVVEGLAEAATAVLNNQALGSASPGHSAEWEITALLGDRNEAQLEFRSPSSLCSGPDTVSAHQPPASVALEIRLSGRAADGT